MFNNTIQEQGHNYFRIIKDGDRKTEYLIVTLECFKCGCKVEADSHRLNRDDEECRVTYSCECPCCHETMFDVDRRTERV